MSESELQARAREMGERLNAMRQDWLLVPGATVTMQDMNKLAGVLAELLHVLAYGEKEATR